MRNYISLIMALVIVLSTFVVPSYANPQHSIILMYDTDTESNTSYQDSTEVRLRLFKDDTSGNNMTSFTGIEVKNTLTNIVKNHVIVDTNTVVNDTIDETAYSVVFENGHWYFKTDSIKNSLTVTISGISYKVAVRDILAKTETIHTIARNSVHNISLTNINELGAGKIILNAYNGTNVEHTQVSHILNQHVGSTVCSIVVDSNNYVLQLNRLKNNMLVTIDKSAYTGMKLSFVPNQNIISVPDVVVPRNTSASANIDAKNGSSIVGVRVYIGTKTEYVSIDRLNYNSSTLYIDNQPITITPTRSGVSVYVSELKYNVKLEFDTSSVPYTITINGSNNVYAEGPVERNVQTSDSTSITYVPFNNTEIEYIEVLSKSGKYTIRTNNTYGSYSDFDYRLNKLNDGRVIFNIFNVKSNIILSPYSTTFNNSNNWNSNNYYPNVYDSNNVRTEIIKRNTSNYSSVYDVRLYTTNNRYKVDSFYINVDGIKYADILKNDTNLPYIISNLDWKENLDGNEIITFTVNTNGRLYIGTKTSLKSQHKEYRVYKNYPSYTNVTLSRTVYKENEPVGVTIKSTNKDCGYESIKFTTQKSVVTLSRGEDSFVLDGNKIVVKWDKDKNGFEEISFVLDKLSSDVNLYIKSVKSLKPISEYIKYNYPAYINGFSNGTFRPYNKLSRSEAIKMLVYAVLKPSNEDLKAYTKMNKFTDVVENAWYKNELSYATSKGYIDVLTGSSSDKFKPYDLISRAEFAALIVSMKDLKLSSNENIEFKDVDKNNRFYDYIITAADNEIVKGYNGEFNPSGPITRAEAVAMINRATNRPNVSINSKVHFTDIKPSDWFYNDVLKSTVDIK